MFRFLEQGQFHYQAIPLNSESMSIFMQRTKWAREVVQKIKHLFALYAADSCLIPSTLYYNLSTARSDPKVNQLSYGPLPYFSSSVFIPFFHLLRYYVHYTLLYWRGHSGPQGFLICTQGLLLPGRSGPYVMLGNGTGKLHARKDPCLLVRLPHATPIARQLSLRPIFTSQRDDVILNDCYTPKEIYL